MVVGMKGRGVAVHEVDEKQRLEVVVHGYHGPDDARVSLSSAPIFFRSSLVSGEEESLDPDG